MWDYQFYLELFFLMNQRSLDLEEIHCFKSHFENSRFGKDSQNGNLCWEFRNAFLLFNMLHKSKMLYSHEVICSFYQTNEFWM
jgi:hypothetical protein